MDFFFCKIQALDYFIAMHDMTEADRKAIKDMHISFDGGYMEQGIFVNKTTDVLDGVADGEETIKIGEYTYTHT